MIIAIIGAGMSGMVSAKALDDLRIDFDIFDKCETNVSQQKGLHYLHDNIGLPLEPYKLKNMVIRPESNLQNNILYSKKIWGNTSVLNNSLVDLSDETYIYNFEEAYNMLMTKYINKVHKMNVDKNVLNEMTSWHSKYDLVIVTIPLFILFPEYICEYETVWSSEILPSNVELNDFTVVYNIEEDVPWYRCSKVFGRISSEYVNQIEGTVPLKKIKTCEQADNDWFELLTDKNILLAGRFAEWNRKRLVHQIYNIVQKGVKEWKDTRM